MAKETDLIIKLRADTARLRKDLNRAKAQMRGFNKNISRIGASIQSSMLAAFGGAAVLQGIRVAVGSLADFEFAMDKVAAISGATGDDLKALQKNALDLGRTTKFTATEIAGLQLELSKLGFSSSKITQSTDAIRKLATVTDEDLGESAKASAGTLNSFNLEASESGRVANTMAEAFSKSSLTLEKFTVGTANSGAIANALGVTLESNTARLSALTDASIDASKGGTDLRKIYIELNKAGLDYDEALDMVAKASDKVGLATELVGIRAAGALVILSNQRKKVDELTKSLGDNKKELNGMVDIMEDNLLTDWKKFTSSIDGLVQKSAPAIKAIRGILQAFTDANNELAKSEIDKRVEPIINQIKLLGNTQGTIDTLTVIIRKYTKALKEGEKQLEKTNERGYLYSGIAKRQEIGVEALKETISLYTSKLKEANEVVDAEADATDLATAALRLKNFEEKEAIRLANIKTSQGSLLDLGIRSQGALNDRDDGEFGLGITKFQIDKQTKEIEDSMARFNHTFEMKGEEFIDISNSMKMAMAAAAIGIFDSIGAAIGGGGESFNNGVNKFLSIIGDGMKSIGAAMVTFATLKIAFDQAIFSNPYVALAVGGALVVAGAALSASAKNADKSVSSGGGGGSSRGGGFAFDRSGQSINITGELVARGQDLALVLENQSTSDVRNRG